ncbi:MAG: hypothetical protein ACTSYF_09500, partial [Promethearchaeota archaeon]
HFSNSNLFSGAEIVSRDVMEVLFDYSEKLVNMLTESAITSAKLSKRKKVSKGYMELTIENLLLIFK